LDFVPKRSILRLVDLTKVLEQLRAELANLDAAIASLERLQQEGRRRGRPPKSMSLSNHRTKIEDPPAASVKKSE
jgi:hypothetical protein